MTAKLAHLNKESWLKTHVCRLIQNIRGNLAWLSFHFKCSVTNIQLVSPQNILNLMLPSLLVCPHLIFDSSCLPDSVNMTKCSSLYQTQHWPVIEATGPCHVILHLVLSLNSFFLSPAMTAIYDVGQWLIVHANVDYSLTLCWSHFNQADLIGFGKMPKTCELCQHLHWWISSQTLPLCDLQSSEAENARVLHLNHFEQNMDYVNISVATFMPSGNFTKLLKIYFRANLAFKLGGFN